VTAVLVVVERVVGMEDRPRVVLHVRVLGGPHDGAAITQGVDADKPVWRYLFLSAGLAPAPHGSVAAAGQLRGLRLRVQLGENGEDLQVRRWLPVDGG